MSILRCPHCKLPLVDEEASGPTCPLCNGVLPVRGRPVPTAAPPTVAPRRRLRPGVLWGVVLALLSVGTLYLAVQPWDPFVDGGRKDSRAPEGAAGGAPERLPVPGGGGD
jgi:hypothetical protein